MSNEFRWPTPDCLMPLSTRTVEIKQNVVDLSGGCYERHLYGQIEFGATFPVWTPEMVADVARAADDFAETLDRIARKHATREAR